MNALVIFKISGALVEHTTLWSSQSVDSVHCGGRDQQTTYVLGLRTIHLTLSLGILMNTFSPALIVSREKVEAMVLFCRWISERQEQTNVWQVVLGLLTTQGANPLRHVGPIELCAFALSLWCKYHEPSTPLMSSSGRHL